MKLLIYTDINQTRIQSYQRSKMSREIDQFAIDKLKEYGFSIPDHSPQNWTRYCSLHSLEDPRFNLIAGNIETWKVRKNCAEKFSEVQYPNLSKELQEILNPISEEKKQQIQKIDDYIKNKRDWTHDFFSIETLKRSYLIRSKEGEIIETPQYMWMRVALGIHGYDLPRAFKTYNYLSEGFFTFATPTLFNSGTISPQMSSCFLMAMKGDSIQGIFDTVSDCAQISKYAGGIGLHIHNIRAAGSHIHGTNGTSNGIVPMLQVFNHTARYVDQGGGKRKGSFAIYMSPWHKDIQEFLELKLNIGDENLRTRDLFLALWVSDLFMKRVKDEKSGEENWTLFCPSETNILNDLVGNDFEEQFAKFENDPQVDGQKVSAKKIWNAILKSQVETGVPYMMFKDACNQKSNQQNLGTIKSSNLCTEIVQFSNNKETAVCNLASICLPRYVKDSGYDFKQLQEVVRHVVYSMNHIIDKNKYPTEEAWHSNTRHRPIGIGVQGLNDVFQMLEMPYDCEDAKDLDALIFETIYYAAVSASCDLAEKYGAYSSFEGSPASKGKLQFDFWPDTELHYNWDDLKLRIQKYGLRNSLLTAVMPTASTSQIQGNTEEVAIPQTNLYSRQTLAGKFMQINKTLVFKLMMLQCWDEKIQKSLVANRGSVQGIKDIPVDLKDIFKTMWETKMRDYIDHAAVRAPFIDQQVIFLNKLFSTHLF